MIYRHYYTAQLLDGVSFADIEKQLGETAGNEVSTKNSESHE